MHIVHIGGFFVAAYWIGNLMTLAALGHADLRGDWMHEGTDAEFRAEQERRWKGKSRRSMLWPWYLWRPW